ncbi:MAG: hypothetical protein VKK59_06190, partial [Vampirovibrionales bacterium]|nr:hypothetical protein [Vampirovibrionales bacterium]
TRGLDESAFVQVGQLIAEALHDIRLHGGGEHLSVQALSHLQGKVLAMTAQYPLYAELSQWVTSAQPVCA